MALDHTGHFGIEVQDFALEIKAFRFVVVADRQPVVAVAGPQEGIVALQRLDPLWGGLSAATMRVDVLDDQMQDDGGARRLFR